MTFKEFKKLLVDAEISLPKFAKLIKVSEKNLQSYKKKDHIPNAIAVCAKCFAVMKGSGMDYKESVESLKLKKKKKEGVGFQKNPENSNSTKNKKDKKK